MKTFCVVFFLTALTACLADNLGCPHPQEARTLIHQQRVQAGPPDSGRHIAEVEVPEQAIRNREISCISLVSNALGSSPDVLGAGRNRLGGLSIKLHSRERSPLDVSLYIYAP